jgi:hypothetical protein
LAHAPAQHKALLLSLCRAASRATTHGVVAQTNRTRDKYWTDWTNFVNLCGLSNPLLPELPHPEQLALVQAFAHWVREGHAGRKDRVGAKRVSQALAAIATTFQLAHQPSPTYQDQGRATYWPALKQQIECYRREDPAPHPKLAVPITVPHYLVLQGLSSINPKQRALGDLICIAFYFLLRVGEYTYKPPKERTRTQRFRVKDIIFRNAYQSIIPNDAPLAQLLTATHATLRISNQKNGKRGQCISHHCTGTSTSPIKALARRVAHIMSYTENKRTTISTYFETPMHPCQITPAQVTASIKHTVHHLALHQFGFTHNTVSSHSLRAGGAMAMKLNGVDTITIKKQGRWSSNTFLNYIQEQIGALTVGVATRMSHYIPFNNTLHTHCSPQLTEPFDHNTTPN